MGCWLRSLLCVGLVIGGFETSATTGWTGEPLAAEHFGFLPLEVTKLTPRARNLLPGDFNHDGLQDLAVVDNSQNRIELLIQQKAGAAAEAAATSTQVELADSNRIADQDRFKSVRIDINTAVEALVSGDFSGDGRTDLAYFSAPDVLVVLVQPEQGQWTQRRQLRIPEVQSGSGCLAGGDLNHDGRDDLLLVGERALTLLLQSAQGQFEPPVRILNTATEINLLQIADLNGDGRNDICYLAGESSQRRVGFRLQQLSSRLGPEQTLEIEQSRSLTVRELDGQPGAEIITIDSRSNRVRVYQAVLEAPSAVKPVAGLTAYGLGDAGTSRERDLILADVDGDARQDVVVTDPAGSRLLLFQQTAAGLDLGRPFASLVGTDRVRALPATTPQTPVELIVSSPTERLLGRTALRDGRLAFPTPLAVDGEPIAIELLPAMAGQNQRLLAILKPEKGNTYPVRVYEQQPGGELVPVPTDKKFELSLSTKLVRLLVADLNSNGLPELICLQQTGKPPVVYELDLEQGLQQISGRGPVQLPAIPAQSATLGRWRDQPCVIVAGDNYVRFLSLSADGRWSILEQVNCAEAGTNLVGAALLDLEAGELPELVMVDAGVKKLRVWRWTTAEGYQPWQEVDLGAYTYRGLVTGDVTGDQRDDLVIVNAECFTVLPAAAGSMVAKELTSFESVLDKAYLTDTTVADFNQDGHLDLAVTDTRSQNLELLQYRAKTGLAHALSFRVFEYKTFAGSDDPGTEPREIHAADVTGDGLTDLLLLVHDRLLVYPQDSGQPSVAAGN